MLLKQFPLTLVVVDGVGENLCRGSPEADRAALRGQLRHRLDAFGNDPHDKFGIVFGLLDAQDIAGSDASRLAGLPGCRHATGDLASGQADPQHLLVGQHRAGLRPFPADRDWRDLLLLRASGENRQHSQQQQHHPGTTVT